MNQKRKSAINRILNQNAEICYMLLPKESLSIEGREDVGSFKDFIMANYKDGTVLDVGCGPLEWPDYLPKEISHVYGIDPSPSKFKGYFVQGIAEDLPFAENFFDSIICATSLDHFLDVEQSLFEISRVIKDKGRLLIWCSLELSKKAKLKVYLRKYLNYLCPKYIAFNSDIIFEIPRGAIDPFHMEYLSPKKVERLLEKFNVHKKTASCFGNDLFMMFEKGSDV